MSSTGHLQVAEKYPFGCITGYTETTHL